MVDHKRGGMTMQDGHKESSPVWMTVLLIVLIFVMLFLLFGGINLLGAGGASTTEPMSSPLLGP